MYYGNHLNGYRLVWAFFPSFILIDVTYVAIQSDGIIPNPL